MDDLPEPMVLYRVDPDQNMARYYRLDIEIDLFGAVTFSREWGRIGRPGQRRVEVCESEAAARQNLSLWAKRKVARGYRAQD